MNWHKLGDVTIGPSGAVWVGDNDRVSNPIPALAIKLLAGETLRLFAHGVVIAAKPGTYPVYCLAEGPEREFQAVAIDFAGVLRAGGGA